MPDRWARFKSRLEDEFLSLKEKLAITIYGSYVPESEIQFLEQQRNFLRNNGYSNTSLVRDHHQQFPLLTPFEISKKCLELSDVNFFIFTSNGKNLGVTVELQTVATDPTLAHKARHCVVFDQIRDNHGNISPLSLNVIENVGIIKRDFSSEAELQTALLQRAFFSLRTLKNELARR